MEQKRWVGLENFYNDNNQDTVIDDHNITTFAVLPFYVADGHKCQQLFSAAYSLYLSTERRIEVLLAA